MEQVRRIREMEQYLDEVSGAVAALSDAVEGYEAVREKLQALMAYYESRTWRQDFDDDAAGKLPPELKRGVLSEDAVYDLLTEHRRLLERLRELTEPPAV